MPTQSIASSTIAPSTAAPSTVASGFIAMHSQNMHSKEWVLDAPFVWSVVEEEACREIRVIVNYGGGADTSNRLEEHIDWGDTRSHTFGPGDNREVWVDGKVSVVWGNYDETAKKYRSFVVLFSGVMMILNTSNNNGIWSSDRYSGLRDNKIIVYAHLE